MQASRQTLADAASAILFGLAHAYQGWRNILRTAVIGMVFAIACVVTRSDSDATRYFAEANSASIFCSPALACAWSCLNTAYWAAFGLA